MLVIRESHNGNLNRCITREQLCLRSGHVFSVVFKTPSPLARGLGSYSIKEFKITQSGGQFGVRKSGFIGYFQSFFGQTKQDCRFISQQLRPPTELTLVNDPKYLPNKLEHYRVKGEGTCLFRTLIAFHERKSCWFENKSKEEVKLKLREGVYRQKTVIAIKKCFQELHRIANQQFHEINDDKFFKKVFDHLVGNGAFSQASKEGSRAAILAAFKDAFGDDVADEKKLVFEKLLLDLFPDLINTKLISEFGNHKLDKGENITNIPFDKPQVTTQPGHFEAIAPVGYFSG